MNNLRDHYPALLDFDSLWPMNDVNLESGDHKVKIHLEHNGGKLAFVLSAMASAHTPIELPSVDEKGFTKSAFTKRAMPRCFRKCHSSTNILTTTSVLPGFDRTGWYRHFWNLIRCRRYHSRQATLAVDHFSLPAYHFSDDYDLPRDQYGLPFLYKRIEQGTFQFTTDNQPKTKTMWNQRKTGSPRLTNVQSC